MRRALTLALALPLAACASPFDGSSASTRGLEEGDDSDSDSDSDGGGDGCTLTQGYWKNHYDGAGAAGSNRDRAWPIDEDTDLCGVTWLATLDISPSGNAFYILAHQYIAASLNVAAGASAPADVGAALDEAESLMADCAVTDAERPRAVELAGLLDDFNNGRVGPGHCDDGPPAGGSDDPPADDDSTCEGELCGPSDPPEGCEGEVCDDGDDSGTTNPEIPPFG